MTSTNGGFHCKGIPAPFYSWPSVVVESVCKASALSVVAFLARPTRNRRMRTWTFALRLYGPGRASPFASSVLLCKPDCSRCTKLGTKLVLELLRGSPSCPSDRLEEIRVWCRGWLEVIDWVCEDKLDVDDASVFPARALTGGNVDETEASRALIGPSMSVSINSGRGSSCCTWNREPPVKNGKRLGARLPPGALEGVDDTPFDVAALALLFLPVWPVWKNILRPLRVTGDR